MYALDAKVYVSSTENDAKHFLIKQCVNKHIRG